MIHFQGELTHKQTGFCEPGEPFYETLYDDLRFAAYDLFHPLSLFELIRYNTIKILTSSKLHKLKNHDKIKLTRILNTCQ
jgi:hypothetical protein